LSNPSNFFAVPNCVNDYYNTTLGTVEKENDAVIAVVSDSITCLIFLVGLYILECYEKEEKKLL
jgi:hypothetical protein